MCLFALVARFSKLNLGDEEKKRERREGNKQRETQRDRKRERGRVGRDGEAVIDVGDGERKKREKE